MGAKHILIANANLQILGDYGRALGKEWGNITLATSSTEALAKMAIRPCDVIVADAGLPEMNGVELLDRIHTEYPKTIRILLASESEKDTNIADVCGSHLILTKPCDNAALKSAVERALAINVWLANDSLRELVGRLRTFPIVPSLYLEVVNALKSQNATTAEVGAIIAKDMAMMTKLLQVTNSACFGLPRKISDPVEAVGILGFETVKTMVMTLKLLSQYDKVKPVYFSIDRLWRHSTEVARIARRITRAQTDDPALAESAFAAGLMHDLGKLILAANFDDQYSGAQELACKQQIPLPEVEKQIFGASHGELGAYLLGLWGMPLDLVETAALHHNPSRSLTKRFTPLTAVHVANALFYEANPDKQGFVPAQLDEAYLAELGLSSAVASWREIAQIREPGATEFRSSGQTVIIKKPSAAAAKSPSRSVKPATVSVPVASAWSFPPSRLVRVGLVVVVFLFLGWIGTQALIQRAVGPSLTPAAVTVPTAAIPPAQPPPQAHPVVSVEKPADKAAPAPVPVLAAATNHPEVATIAPVAPVAPPSPKELAFAQLQLQSIFYSRSHPSAVINGQAVRPNDQLPAGAVVVEINPSSVTVQFDHERKTLALK